MVIIGVISGATILTTHVRGLITPLRTTHEPPSSMGVWDASGIFARQLETLRPEPWMQMLQPTPKTLHPRPETPTPKP